MSADILNRHTLEQLILSQIILDHHYHYQILQNHHIEQTVTMFTHAFCDAEPMTHYVKMDYHSFLPFAEAVVRKAARDQLSIIALDQDRVIACALVEDFMHPLNIDFEMDPKFKYIFSLLEKISGEFFKDKKIPSRLIAHLFISAVDAKYRGLGISKQVNFRAMALAEKHKYAFMLSELTNYINEKGIIPHLKGAKLQIGSQVYQDYIFEGTRPFENLMGSAHSFLWELHPDAKLKYEEKNKSVIKTLSEIV